MAEGGSTLNQVVQSVGSMKVDEQLKQENATDGSDGSNLQITCFSDLVDDVTLHFQVIRLPGQIYAWVGCNSAKFGRLYAAAPTRPNNTVSVSSILGGVSDNTGSGIARRLVLKTGLNVILACNIPKNSPMLEVNAEKKLVEKLISLGYTRCDLYLYNSAKNFVVMGDVFNEKDGVARFISEAIPTHYTVKIQLFSLLLKNAVENYESGEFQAGGYKWKLVLYPNGNKKKNVQGHISLYLAMADTSLLCLGWEVYAVVRLFLLDQNKDNYLIVQDALGKEKRFHGFKVEWGFDHFIPLEAFNDASSGYLVEDSCVFGAEVFVTKERSTGKGECLSMIKDAQGFKQFWRIENFSKLDKECHDSEEFSAGDHKWKIRLHPKGTGSHLSLYLTVADLTTLTPGSKIYAEVTLRILDQVQARHMAGKANHWFSASRPDFGWARFISLGYFKLSANGYLVKDVCLVEAEVTVLGISRAVKQVGSN